MSTDPGRTSRIKDVYSHRTARLQARGRRKQRTEIAEAVEAGGGGRLEMRLGPTRSSLVSSCWVVARNVVGDPQIVR